MANWSGLVARNVRGATDGAILLTGTSFVGTNGAMPGKYFPHGQFAVIVTEGVSGGFSVNIIGAVAGATFPIATRQNITAVGSFPIPAITYVGVSGTVTGSIGVPRPFGVAFIAGTTAAGTSWPVGFTASVYFAGEY